MRLTDTDLRTYDSLVLRIRQPKRKEYLDQVDHLIEQLTARVREDGTFSVRAFRKAGSLKKGTALRPRDGLRVDADVAVYLDVLDRSFDIERLHAILRDIVRLIYPTKADADFEINPKTLGIAFAASALDIDLVPVLPDDDRGEGWGWQPSSTGDDPVLTCIPGQLDFIRARKQADPRYRVVVRLAKRWRDHQELENLRSFPIELWLAHLYDQEGPCASIESGLLRLFGWIAQDQLGTPVLFAEHGRLTRLPDDPVVTVDPVNGENNVTARLTEADRSGIVKAATTGFETLAYARRATTQGETLDLWKELLGRSFRITE
ncbi:MAG TPA: CBASS oligonucleotide cyclase [Actinomycetes bacterium]|jgi:hypothetical protein|nr:CBASS oligonucleotide cyclase [Actinomycetes bacterium]